MKCADMRSMVIVLTVSFLVIAVSAAFIWFLSSAPEGYENETGFHYSTKSSVAAKPVVKAAPATLAAHNDHEPLAA